MIRIADALHVVRETHLDTTVVVVVVVVGGGTRLVGPAFWSTSRMRKFMSTNF
jgi:hypothetical protein